MTHVKRPQPQISTQDLQLVGLFEVMPGQMLTYFNENREHFAPTHPPYPKGFFTEPYWSEKIQNSYEEFQNESAVRFVLLKKDIPSRVVGTVNFTQIFRGPFQACYLGYGIDQKHQGKGLMSQALGAAIQYIFSDFNLHRIMANYMPENQRSSKLLSRMGFKIEGKAQDYLFINGQWRDHVLTALNNPNWTQNIATRV